MVWHSVITRMCKSELPCPKYSQQTSQVQSLLLIASWYGTTWRVILEWYVHCRLAARVPSQAVLELGQLLDQCTCRIPAVSYSPNALVLSAGYML